MYLIILLRRVTIAHTRFHSFLAAYPSDCDRGGIVLPPHRRTILYTFAAHTVVRLGRVFTSTRAHTGRKVVRVYRFTCATFLRRHKTAAVLPTNTTLCLAIIMFRYYDDGRSIEILLLLLLPLLFSFRSISFIAARRLLIFFYFEHHRGIGPRRTSIAVASVQYARGRLVIRPLPYATFPQRVLDESICHWYICSGHCRGRTVRELRQIFENG